MSLKYIVTLVTNTAYMYIIIQRARFGANFSSAYAVRLLINNARQIKCVLYMESGRPFKYSGT